MMTSRFINPYGDVVEVPTADAEHFIGKGWKRAGENQEAKASDDDLIEEDTNTEADASAKRTKKTK